MITCNLQRALSTAALALAVSLAAASAEAATPNRDEDISGRTVYLNANSWLRYSNSLIGRIYTTTKGVMELKGRGRCERFFCPVTHNNIELWARRVSLDLAQPAGPVLTNRSLRRGDEGADVGIAQQALVKLGYAIAIDNKYGRGTESAVRDFQRKQALVADGVVGPATRIALKL